jgi:sugar transferase EpsL
MFFKRALDIVGSITGLILFSPLMIVVSILILLKLGRPVFYQQKRPGLHGKPFTILKFRTMIDLRNEKGDLLPDERRLPAFGRFLRSASLDELPELWNVLRGEMSLVGPRPLLMQYLPLYNSEQRRRHDVKPGMTGWAQINGRNALSWEDRFKLDVWYVDNRSFPLDLKILFLTILATLRRKGISAEGHATMPYFAGSPPDSNQS